MRYCYKSSDVTWGGDPLELEFWSGDGGCAGGSSTRWALAAAGGDSLAVTTTNAGGFALYYGELNPNQTGASGQTATAHTFQFKNFTAPLLSNISGTPAFGIAVNCPSAVTCEDFSGLVLLFDYVTNEVILGQYTNGNLNNGDRPTTISTLTTIPDASDFNEWVLSNGYLSLGSPVIEVFLTGNSSYSFNQEISPAKSLVSSTAGYGVFWVKSAAAAAFQINYDDNTSAILTFT